MRTANRRGGALLPRRLPPSAAARPAAGAPCWWTSSVISCCSWARSTPVTSCVRYRKRCRQEGEAVIRRGDQTTAGSASQLPDRAAQLPPSGPAQACGPAAPPPGPPSLLSHRHSRRSRASCSWLAVLLLLASTDVLLDAAKCVLSTISSLSHRSTLDRVPTLNLDRALRPEPLQHSAHTKGVHHKLVGRATAPHGVPGSTQRGFGRTGGPWPLEGRPSVPEM